MQYGIFILLAIVYPWPALATDFLSEGPVSVNALIGETALFRCMRSGTGAGVIVWKVDGLLLATGGSITDRGITSNVSTSPSGTILSILSIRSSIMNNGTTVQCVLLSLSGPSMTSNNATLTILNGIAQVTNIRLNPKFNSLLWNHAPSSGLMYHVILTNTNTDEVLVNVSTSSARLKLPTLQLCQHYTANVTAFTPELHSDAVVTELRVPGEYYGLVVVSNEVAVYNSTHFRVNFIIDIQERSVLVCPQQEILPETYPTANSSVKTAHSEVAIMQPGAINLTIFVENSCHCAADLRINANDRDIEMETVFFSTYMIQSCHVTPDHASILVACTFAINSNISGAIVVVENNNKTQKKLFQQDRPVIFTGLEPGEYIRVRAYDDDSSSTAAFEQTLFLNGVISSSYMLHSSITLSTETTRFLSSSHGLFSSRVLPSHSPVMPTPTTVIGVSILAAVVPVIGIILVAVGIVVMIIILRRKRNKLNLAAVQREENDHEEIEGRYTELAIIQQPGKEPVYSQYSVIQRDFMNQSHYADIQHYSTDPAPAAALPLDRVQYAAVIASV